MTLRNQYLQKSIETLNLLLDEVNRRQIILRPETVDCLNQVNLLAKAINRTEKEEKALNKILEDLKN